MCTCVSMKPGRSVSPPRSIVTGPGAVPTRTIFPSRTVTTASFIVCPLPSNTRRALIVTSLDCANADAVLATRSAMTGMMRILMPRQESIRRLHRLRRFDASTDGGKPSGEAASRSRMNAATHEATRGRSYVALTSPLGQAGLRPACSRRAVRLGICDICVICG